MNKLYKNIFENSITRPLYFKLIVKIVKTISIQLKIKLRKNLKDIRLNQMDMTYRLQLTTFG